MSSTSTLLTAATAPMARRVRAYFAPVNRAAELPTLFDPAQAGSFALDTPPAPWLDLGWVSGFTRKCETKVGALVAGAPAMVQTQVRSVVEATVSLDFESWGKLQLAIAAGSEQMKLLATANGTAANGSGGLAAAPSAIQAGSTATILNVGAGAAATFTVGGLVAVDVNYTGQVGYVGSGVSAAYVTSAATVASDVNYIRRVSLNVGRIVSISGGALTLGAPLLAGVPTTAMQASPLVGFCDREGGRFFQEWSALFVVDGEQGDRVLYHYPRLQAMQGAAEISSALAPSTTLKGEAIARLRLAGAFRALPVVDANDGASVVCFRSYLPGPMRSV